MCSDLGSGSRCCALYSFTGILFTVLVGTLLATQPFLIAGIEDEEHAKKSAFGAALMFVITFVASLCGIWYDSQYKIEPIDGNGSTVDPSSLISSSDYHLSKDDNNTVPKVNYGTTA